MFISSFNIQIHYHRNAVTLRVEFELKQPKAQEQRLNTNKTWHRHPKIE
jgi:hypothetical protein